MTTLLNPFALGGVVRGDRFAGRAGEVRRIRRLAVAGERVYLFAPRRYGKTSLLREALAPSAERRGLVLVWCDCLPANDVTELTQRVAAAVVEAARRKRGTEWIAEAGRLFRDLRPSISLDQSGQARVDVRFDRADATTDPVHSLEDAFHGIARLAKRKKKPVAVVLDEFQQLAEWDRDARAEAVIRTAIQQQSGCAYFFAGSQRHLLEEMFADRSRPLYRLAAPFPLGRLTAEEVTPWLTARFGGTGMRLADEAADRLGAVAAGHPWALQYLSHFVWEVKRQSRDRRVTGADVELGLEEALRVGGTAYQSEVAPLTATQRRVLAAIAREPTATPTSAAYLRRHALPAKSSVSQALGTLAKRGHVEELDGVHVSGDPLFAEWIRRRW